MMFVNGNDQELELCFKSTPEIDEMEQDLYSLLQRIKERHARELEPLIRKLAELDEMKTPFVVFSSEYTEGDEDD